MLDALPKATFSMLAGSSILKALASRYGMRPAGFARRFVAGEDVNEAIEVARRLEAASLTVTLDYLGEHVETREAATAATRAYIDTVRAVTAADVSRNLSVKLTQLGLNIDRATAIDNLRRVLDVASRDGFFVRIDMEGSAYTDQTFEVFQTLWNIGCREIGVVIQSALRRSAADLERMVALGARVRLVKGAYREPKAIAFQQKAEVDQAFVDGMRVLLRSGIYHAIATHDVAMIDATRDFAAAEGIARTAFEFQMLYGIRRDLQRSLRAEGYPCRVYLPFGTEWFPYFMRRLGERPANVTFVLKGLADEAAEA